MHQRRIRLFAVGTTALVLTTTSPALAADVPAAPTSPANGVQVQVQPGYTLTTIASGSYNQASLAKNAHAAILMDAATGKVLFEKEADEEMPMASITKIMTLLLVLEAVDSGRLKLSDSIKASEYAASMGGSQIFLEPGETMKAEDMIKGIAVASANDACVAMAEHLDGTEENFVKRMNKRAHQLGMEHTHFVNCNGLPAKDHYSSAGDIAIMSRALLKHSEVTKWTSVYSDYLRKDSDHPLWLVNTNKLVRFYDGVDGLKTGYTSQAKYCLSATAKRDGFRVIAVVLGEPKSTVRNAEVSSMLNWAFSQYRSKIVFESGVTVQQVEVTRGEPEYVSAVATEPVGFVYRTGTKVKTRTEVQTKKLTAPVHKGDAVGTVTVYNNGEKVAQEALVAGADSARVGFWVGLKRTVRDLVTFGQRP